MTKRALILGVGGQDGSYLADVLLERGYEVHGLYRRSSSDNLWRIRSDLGRIRLYRGDLTDETSLARAVVESNPHEIYNEADQDHVGWSHELPGQAMDVTARAVGVLLEIVRRHDQSIRVFQPVSATMFGDPPCSPQDELTRLDPLSPYAVAKAAAYHLCRFYRRRYDMFVSTAIMYNHDSPRRSKGYLLDEMLTKATSVRKGQADRLLVGDPNAVVDIGYSREYMDAAQQILQLNTPDDFVLASGRSQTVGDVAAWALETVGIEPSSDLVGVDSRYARSDKPAALVGDIGKARKAFGFDPRTTVRTLLAAKYTAKEGER